MKWYLDFGHGGHDPGAVGNNKTQESNVVLKIGMLIKKNLEDAFEKVVTTREDDKYYSLDHRSNKANNENCDYFVSLHMNFFKNKETKGTEVWVYNLDSKLASLAKDLCSNLSKTLDTPNRGVKISKELAVLRKTNMPSMLIEVDFISNNYVEASCSSDLYINKIANTISSALLSFVGKSIEYEDTFYKVCIGIFNNKDNALKLKNEAISKSFYDTYIIRN